MSRFPQLIRAEWKAELVPAALSVYRTFVSPATRNGRKRLIFCSFRQTAQARRQGPRHVSRGLDGSRRGRKAEQREADAAGRSLTCLKSRMNVHNDSFEPEYVRY